MWLLLSTFSLVFVCITGRPGVIVVHPGDVELLQDTVISKEIDLPDEIVFPYDGNLQDDIDFPNEVSVPGDSDLKDNNFPDVTDPEEDINPEENFDSMGDSEENINPEIEPGEDTEEYVDLDEDINPEKGLDSNTYKRDINTKQDIVPDNPTVNITQGTVEGSYAANGIYMQFYGIPYASTTSGPNRFKAPTPPPTFQDTFVANRSGIKCIRALGAGFEGTEDCLVANVFTKTLDSSRRLPVMVWVKGKEFNTGEFEPSFKNFMDQDILIVTMNYRESVLGFLCLGTETAPGNAGLKDIIAGLRWVQGNIAQFGGNPNDVTLVGHGSGAAAVDLVTLSPMANGLVHKAIAQSGNALSPWAVSRDNFYYAIQVAEALGHVVTNAEELSEVFQRTSVVALMGVLNQLDLTDNSLAFAPCIERNNLEGIEPFMIKTPYQTFRDGDFLQIPFITGYVDNEGTIRSKEAIEDNWLEKMDVSFNEFIQQDLEFETDEEQTQIVQNIRSFYFQNNSIDMEHIENYINYHGDTMILLSALRETRMRVATATAAAPVFLYQFSYKGTLGEPLVGPLEVDSAAHSEELAYIFYNDNNNDISQRDRTIGDILVQRWSWFARTGQPLSATSSVFWQAYTAAQSNYIKILNNDEIDNQSAFDVSLVNPYTETLAFWDPIYENNFLDAKINWTLTENDVDEDQDEGSGEDNGSGEDGEDNGSGEDGEDGNSSATSAVGYTFSIIALFSLLKQAHLSQILS